MVGGELDPELPHQTPGDALAVQQAREVVVPQQDLPLLLKTRLATGLARREIAGLLKDPRVPDAPPSDADCRYSRQLQHGENVFGHPDVARTKDDSIGVTLNQSSEELPAAGALVPLLNRATVDRRPRIPDVVRALEDSFKTRAHLGRVIPGAAKFHGAWNRSPNGVMHGFEDLNRCLGVRQKMPAATSLLDLLDRAREVDVHGVVAHFNENRRPRSHLPGIGSHDLTGERMVVERGAFVVVDRAHAALTGDQIRIFATPALAAVDERSIKQRFGHAEWAAVLPRNQTHGTIGVPGKARLKKRRIEPRNRFRNPRIKPPRLGDRLNGPLQSSYGHTIWAKTNRHVGNRTTMPPMIRIALLLGIFWSGASGCTGRIYDPARATVAYPSQLAQGETILAQATRDRDELVIVNATSRSFTDIKLWVNQRYMHQLDRFGAGETVRLPITTFFDAWGETPIPGGFLRTDRPTRILLVQIQTDATSPLLGLVTIPVTEAF